MRRKNQVFLGGSCNPTTWREDTAVLVLREAGVRFFNPQVSDWDESMPALEAKAKEESELLLFVIDRQTRAIASILEATEFTCTGRNVLLVIDDIEDGTEIAGQAITGRELRDLNRARSYLRELSGRYENSRICDSIETATAAAVAHFKMRDLVHQ